jgi:hypothetical protein
MAGKKPVPSPAQRSSSAAPIPKKASKSPASGAKARSPAKPRKISNDKPEPGAGAKHKKQQASCQAGTPLPKKKGKKRDEPESTAHKEAASTKKKQQSHGRSAMPANKHLPRQRSRAHEEAAQGEEHAHQEEARRCGRPKGGAEPEQSIWGTGCGRADAREGLNGWCGRHLRLQLPHGS